mmetsp:Transcript_38380/g.90247  ORF Transcript_38380/g.90247 Transcript_38380/m.90247 type:complete len:289 (+) Transcript_38380:44-910(+)
MQMTGIQSACLMGQLTQSRRLRRRGVSVSGVALLACALSTLAYGSGCFAGASFRLRCGSSHRNNGAVAAKALAPLTDEEMAAIQEWEKNEGVLTDSAANEAIAAAAFPIPPEELIMRAKNYLAKNQYSVVEPDLLADNFTFCGPVVGPLSKENFIQVLNGLDFRSVIPDNRVRWHHFRVDPFDPSRVLFTGRPTGKNTGSLPVLIPEEGGTGITYEGPPEAASMKFLADGKLVEYTAAYVMDKNQGTTGGMTGILGVLYGLGRPLPFPEGQPWKPSPFWQVVKWLGQA